MSNTLKSASLDDKYTLKTGRAWMTGIQAAVDAHGDALPWGLSIKTVETHRSQIMKRLQIYDVAGLVLFAVREKIISLDD